MSTREDTQACGATPYVAAVSGIGANREARVTRRKYDYRRGPKGGLTRTGTRLGG